MPLPVRLDHCVIHVTDWERSNAFYTAVLGAELIPRPVGFAYRFGDRQLNVHGPGVAPAEVARLPVAPGNSDLCFEWNGPIADAMSHLQRCRVPVEAGVGRVQRPGEAGVPALRQQVAVGLAEPGVGQQHGDRGVGQARLLERQNETEKALYTFTDRLFRAESRNDVYDAGLDAILDMLRCDRASILLFDDCDVMRFVAWRALSSIFRPEYS